MVNFLWENFFRKDQQSIEIQKLLRECFVFNGLSLKEISLLQKIVHLRHYRPGEPVFQQGEIGVGMYIVMKGTIDIHIDDSNPLRRSEDPKQRNIFITQLKVGDFFGEQALIEEQSKRSATAISCGETTLVGFFRPDLQEITDRSPSTGVKILYQLSEVLGKRLKETTFKVSELKRQIEQFTQLNSKN